MPKSQFDCPNHPQRVPSAPEPSSASASEGMEQARVMARRYLPDMVRLLAGIALAPESEARLHTRMVCAKEVDAIAGVIPQAVPEAPQPSDEDGDGSDPAAS